MNKTLFKEKPIRILVADDDQLFLHIVRRLLEEEGFVVLTASSGLEALKMALRNYPDLIILDSNMPILAGEEVCRRIKMEKIARPVPVIILSGLEDEESIKRFSDSGCDDYFPKSKLIYDISISLKEKVRKALNAL